MFKRFLKFLRGDEEDGQSAGHEGSYLDHLLRQIEPEVVRSLERCPENDPLLLVVAGVLRQTMLSVFHPVVDEPLVDFFSPGMKPPAPPEVVTGEFDRPEEQESVAEEDVEIVEEIDENEKSDPEEPETSETEEVEVDEEPPAEVEKKAEVEKNAEKVEDSDNEAVEELNDPDTDEIPVSIAEDGEKRITQKFDTEEIRKVTDSDGSTGEIEIKIGEDNAEHTAELSRDELDDRPRLDTPETLAAGRTFLKILTSNDQLPPDSQLSVAELMVVRDHLLKRDDDHGRKLLALVESKFNDAFFGQARLLLTLFPTDDLTALNNDRNIFYEEMILKLGIKRRHRMSDEDLEVYDNLVEHMEEHGIQPLLNWFRSECGVKLHVCRVDPNQAKRWTELTEICSRPNAQSYVSAVLPTTRWREINQEEDPYEVIHGTLTYTLVREYIVSMIGTCYFVLRAVGDTGLEPFLDSFFDWTRDNFELNGTILMPALHKRAMTDITTMQTIIDDLFENHFAATLDEEIASWNPERIKEAIEKTFSSLSGPKLGEIAPGDYNLAAFVLDELLGIKYPEVDFPFKIHRLT